MRIEAILQEYFQEVCEEVCRRCAARLGPDVEWPPPGTPCGHELHLVQLIQALGLRPSGRDAQPVADPPPEEFCPCAAEQLAALAAQAAEALERRRQARLRLLDHWDDL